MLVFLTNSVVPDIQLIKYQDKNESERTLTFCSMPRPYIYIVNSKQ